MRIEAREAHLFGVGVANGWNRRRRSVAEAKFSIGRILAPVSYARNPVIGATLSSADP